MNETAMPKVFYTGLYSDRLSFTYLNAFFPIIRLLVGFSLNQMSPGVLAVVVDEASE